MWPKANVIKYAIKEKEIAYKLMSYQRVLSSGMNLTKMFFKRRTSSSLCFSETQRGKWKRHVEDAKAAPSPVLQIGSWEAWEQSLPPLLPAAFLSFLSSLLFPLSSLLPSLLHSCLWPQLQIRTLPRDHSHPSTSKYQISTVFSELMKAHTLLQGDNWLIYPYQFHQLARQMHHRAVVAHQQMA